MKVLQFNEYQLLKILLLLAIYSFSLATSANELITPIPDKVPHNPNKAKLGKKLFFDPRLSSDNTISCASCHDFAYGGAENKRFSVGVEGRLGKINSPTVFNAVFNFVQFWNGRAEDLYEQALGPLTDPNEMNNDLNKLIKKLRRTEYFTEFKRVYPNGLNITNLVDALVEYQKTLITPNSPFDKYLKGDEQAISSQAKEGYNLFKKLGCIACHNGVNLGGNLFAKFGSANAIESDSTGRYEVTNNKLDMYHFKVPGLRNIELTAPYMHDGRIETLEEAVSFMGRKQLGKTISNSEVEKMVEFLKTLTGELNAN